MAEENYLKAIDLGAVIAAAHVVKISITITIGCQHTGNDGEGHQHDAI